MFALSAPLGFMQINDRRLFVVHMTSVIYRKRAKLSCANRDGSQRAKAVIVAYLVHAAGLFALAEAHHGDLRIAFWNRCHVRRCGKRREYK